MAIEFPFFISVVQHTVYDDHKINSVVPTFRVPVWCYG